MVLNGIFNNIGDSLTVELEGIANAISLLGYIDTTNETIDKYFEKKIRYSQDDKFTYTDWIELSNANLQALSLNLYRILWFEIIYTRTGSDETGTLELEYFELQVNIDTTKKTLYPVIFSNQNHIFGHIEVNDIDWHTYCIIIAKKIWGEGIVANFVERTDEFWYFFKTVACYLSLYYIYAKELENLYYNEELLREYITQRGLFLCGNEGLAELQNLNTNFYDQIRKRGTSEAFDEIKRVICNNSCDEFILTLIHNNFSGWFVDRTSINYMSLEGVDSLNKLPTSPIDKTELVWINDHLVSIVSDTVIEGEVKNVFEINNFSNDCGVKYDKTFVPDDGYIFNVSPLLNYEVSFIIKQVNTLLNLEFGIDLFDCQGNLIDAIDLVTGANNNNFIAPTTLLNFYPKDYVKIKACLFNKDEGLRSFENCKLNIGVGNYLKMPENASYAYPKIIIKGNGTINRVRIYNSRMALLDYKFPVSSYIEQSNFIIAYIKNNNKIRSDYEVEEIIDKYLLPLSTHLDFNLL